MKKKKLKNSTVSVESVSNVLKLETKHARASEKLGKLLINLQKKKNNATFTNF